MKINWRRSFFKSSRTRIWHFSSCFIEQPVHKWKSLSPKQLADCDQSQELILRSTAKTTLTGLLPPRENVCWFPRGTCRISAPLVLLVLYVVCSRMLSRWRQNNKQGNKASGPEWKPQRGCWGLLRKVMKFNYMMLKGGKKIVKARLPIMAGIFTLHLVDKICCKIQVMTQTEV